MGARRRDIKKRARVQPTVNQVIVPKRKIPAPARAEELEFRD